MFNILLAPNSFKESAVSTDICRFLKTSFHKNIPQKLINKICFIEKPLSDGGDGFLDVCSSISNLEIIEIPVSYPFGNKKFDCKIGYNSGQKIVYIESARVLGLNIIPCEERNPLNNSSKGLGELLLWINENLIAEKVKIGIGGTGTSDLGLGAIEKLGVKFNGIANITPGKFLDVTGIEQSVKAYLKFKIECICDVNNLLTGTYGTNFTYAEQKGAGKNDLHHLEAGFMHILNLLGVSGEALNGSGGGLAAGLNLFFGASLVPAKEFILNDLSISSKNSNFDIIITGEGKFDSQSSFGKGAGIIIKEFDDALSEKYLLCGTSEVKKIDNCKIIELRKYFSSMEDSITRIEEGIDSAVREVIYSSEKLTKKFGI